ncbi:DUF1707 domain-containing protein [Mycolicibacterium hippocampi]|uniref:2TM domain-containing protein n=1 Tax=Mycolicibacterium hippocampi TaxID=659824 RepID=A0A7I9ZJY7_9MYCO|nr:DUF1707 domain-containing protein [Mycolicibacterium hippocampi]GFH01153.1 hypothetical protein MHIP_16360 [Mycolicibacterium hippocampi]
MDLRESVTTGLRAGDHDRESVATLLGQALAQGYLDMGEYEKRLQAAFAAQTTPELRHLTSDLPLAQLRRSDPRRRAARRAAARRGVAFHLAAYLAMVVVVLTVWLVVGLTAGAWYFWPIWPILGAGIGVVAHAVPVKFALPVGCTRLTPEWYSSSENARAGLLEYRSGG